MYCDFFGLRCRPFEDRADAQFFCPLADSEEALAAMEYESHFGKGMALVLGDSGTGKTLLIRTLLGRLDKSDHVVVLTWSQAALRDLVRAVAKGFGVSLPSSHRDTRCVSRLRRSLTRALKTGHRSILIIDQAENLTCDQLAQLTTLADFEYDGSKLLNIIMVGQPRLQELVNQPDFARLRQQLFGERTLKPLSLESAKEYVKHRLRIAGGGDAGTFDDDAIAIIHEASKGIPRLINHMCNAAMLAAYGAGKKRIHRALAAEVVGRTCPLERSADASALAVSSVGDVAAGLTGVGSRGISGGLERPDRGGTKESSHTENAAGDASTLVEAMASGLLKTEKGSDLVDANLVNHVSGEPVISPHDQEDSLLCDPGESAVVDVEDIVNRLERALARADRVSTTTEASLAQHQAMEKHLLSLSTGAERIAARLTSATERSSAVWGALQHRVEKVVGDGERRAEAIEAQVSRAAEASGETSEQMQRIENACRHAEGIESSLRLYAERLADKADEVQQRITLLLRTLEASKTAQSGLDAAVERASSSVEEAERKIDSGLTSLADANKDASKKRRQLIENTVLECGRELEAQKETHERLSREAAGARTRALEAQKETHERLAREAAEARTRELEAQRETYECLAREAAEASEARAREVQELANRASKVTSDADKTLELAAKTLSEAKGEVECFGKQFVADAIEDLRKGFEQRQETRDLAASRAEEAEEALERKLEQFMDRASATTTDGNQMIGLMRATLKEVRAEAGDIKRRFIEEVLPDCREEIQLQLDAQLRRHQESIEVMFASHRANVQRLIDESTPRLRSMEQAIADGRRNADEVLGSFERSSADLFESVGSGVCELREKMDTLGARHDDMQSSVEALHDTAATAAARIRDAATSADEIKSTMDVLDHRADACRASMSKTIQQGDNLLQGMQAACGRAEATQRNLNASLIEVGAAGERIGAMGDRIAEGERMLTHLATEHAEGAKTAGRLEEIGLSGHQLHEALQELVTHADGKLGQLDSHSAAATRILRDLTDANTTAHEAKDRIDEAVQSTRDAASEAESTARAVADRLEATQTKADRVREQAQQGVTLLETAESAAQQAAHRIESQVESARAQEGSLQGVLTNTEETIGRIDSHHAAASSVVRELSEATETASRQARTLAELSESSGDRIQTVLKTEDNAEATEDEVAARKEAADRSVEIGGSVVKEFITQARAAQRRICEFEERADRVEQVLREATTSPARVVAAAQAQAAQLERVCSAVRKIFGAVSKASLSAKQQSSRCTEVSEQSARRLAQLSSETDRATATIREWVEEAKRAQSRLEGTLRRCPSIKETHPAENLRRLSDVVSPADRISDAGVAGEFRTLSEPEQTQTTHTLQSAARPNRADEIARLIQDAKEAVANTKV